MEIPIHIVTWESFAARVEALAPGLSCTETRRLDEFPLYQRIRITRWLEDYFEDPTPLDHLDSFETLGEAFTWVAAAIDAGRVPRGRPAARRRSGVSTRVRLRPIVDADFGPLYLASFDPSNAGRWRYHGRTLPMDQFVPSLFNGVLAQFMVEMVQTGIPIGLVVAYDENPSGLHCKLAFLRTGARVSGDTAALFEGIALFISYLFDHFPFRKLFAEVPEFNLHMFTDDFADHEGVLKEFLFYQGEFADMHYVSVSRNRWADLSAQTGW